MTSARRFLVRGRVQGVAYRAHTQLRARELAVAGFVRNLRDGRVEVVAQGGESELAALEDWCRRGPPGARVDALEVAEGEVDATRRDFLIEATSRA